MQGQSDYTTQTYPSTLVKFLKIEVAMQSYFEESERKGIFIDPPAINDYFFKSVIKIAPEFLCNTEKYRDDLLKILADSTISKKTYTNLHIAYLLYNLPVKNYVIVLEKVCELYENGSIDFFIFDVFIFPNSEISNEVVKNYQNPDLIHFFDTLLTKEPLLEKAKTEEFSVYRKKTDSFIFVKAVESWKKGTMWNGVPDEINTGLKIIDEIQPPILDTLVFDCP
jgi:hypothetical protein